MLLIEVQDVKLYIKDRLLLNIDKLEIHHDARIGLVGKNGSGKTSLLEVLVGERTIDSGSVQTYGICELLPQLKRTNTTKSGGEITQDYVIQAFTSNPSILLADEPTTHLDTEHIEWLEKRFGSWQGALLLVSHDRDFLDSLCTTIWELENGSIKVYKGNYSAYLEQKELERKNHEAAYEKYEKKKKQLEDALLLKERKAARATKAPKNVSASEASIMGAKPYFAKKQKKLQKTVKAIETRIDKLEKVEKIKELPSIQMSLPNEDVFMGRIILRVENLPCSFGTRILWTPASFHVRGGDKLAIIGANGSGKTTLLKKIVNGSEGITLSPALKLGYFSQSIDQLNTAKTILENVQSTSKQSETFIRIILARLHFYREDVYKKVDVLSGGERVKVALAKLFVCDINTLILDEPTNFLDIDAVEALEELLGEYAGTIIFVSHDRRFIRKLATRILEIKDGKIQIFDGSYDELQSLNPPAVQNSIEYQRLLIDTKMTEVLSRLSIDPSPALEAEFQALLAEKKKLNN